MRLSPWWAGLLAAVMLAGSPMPIHARAVPAQTGSPHPVVTPLADGLELEWSAPEPRYQEQDGRLALVMAGFTLDSQPGAARLPLAAAWVALPPGAEPQIELLRVDERAVDLPGNLAAAPEPDGALRGPDGQLIGGAYRPAGSPARLPAAPLEWQRAGRAGGVELGQVIFRPAYERGGQLWIVARLQARVRFNTPSVAQALSPAGESALLPGIAAKVLNPGQVQPSPVQTPAKLRLAEVQSTLAGESPALAAVEVAQAGLAQISYEQLSAAGIDLAGMDPARLRVLHDGVELAAEWEGDGDAAFEAGERLLFYADPQFSRWMVGDVYFLQPGSSPARRMSSRSASPGSLPAGAATVTAPFEENHIYTPNCYCAPLPPGRDGDRWTWAELSWPAVITATFSFDLPAVKADAPAWLEIWLEGYTSLPASPDHRVEMRLNGALLGATQWDGKTLAFSSFAIPTGTLLEGANSLELRLPGLAGVSVEGAWLDAFTVRYERSQAAAGQGLLFTGEEGPHAYTLALASSNGLRAYDVSDPEAPVRLTGLANTSGKLSLGDPASGGERSYWVTSGTGILSPAKVRPVTALQPGPAGADYLVITPAEFKPALNPLLNLRQAQGLTVAVEDVQAIYDAYGWGRPEPEAIQSYLARAYATWSPRPAYVLLVGDGTSDPRHYSPASSQTWIPPYLDVVDPWAGETAADNRYAAVDGEDYLPDLLIGRLPVNSLAEAQTVVDKIVAYESAPPAGAWAGRVVLAADDPDDAGGFPTLSDAAAAKFFSAAQRIERVYVQPGGPGPEALRSALLGDWNSGALLVMYTGHASVHQWAAESLLHKDQVGQLLPGQKLPLVLEMTCFTASFQLPTIPALDEALLRQPAGGAVAVWGPTGLGVASGHVLLAEGFLGSLKSGATFGAAALEGKLNVAANQPSSPDLIDTFTLLGDPATRLSRTAQMQGVTLPVVVHSTN